MRVLILGAGVIGVTSAWYLAKQGFEVTVVDRQATPAASTESLEVAWWPTERLPEGTRSELGSLVRRDDRRAALNVR